MINAHKTQASLEKDTHKQTHAHTPTHKREREREMRSVGEGC